MVFLSTRKAGCQLMTTGFRMSGQEDSNLRPHGPEPYGDATQVPILSSDAPPASARCTTGCTSKPENANDDTLADLAAKLAALAPADRARLAAMLLGGQSEWN